ncbi:hypothetical protein J8L98_02875 [Pseudoalteromonas sp. MMG013]|uniref:hypothetical protein n=1 Tax=unclassified Pseudoalteromonas TaxID=194690 RepID=UPI001B381497|nr:MULTISPECIES: hypothetical protein [unclassified Pseudoalteromonas]MBQ4849936.1 hypothetical protein [Pseudoalteromonas sp. MMG012]MBQ4860638.1 hypothetical protein [Pseudoalteromonas sp. MMG013]
MVLISSLFFVAALNTASDLPNINGFKERTDKDPLYISTQFAKYNALPPSLGAFTFYKNILIAAVKHNVPDIAVKVSKRLSQPEWQEFPENKPYHLLNNLGILYRKNRFYSKALLAYQCGLDFAVNNPNEQVKILLNMYSSQLKLGMHDEALSSLKQAESMASAHRDKQRIKQKKASLHLDAGQYELAQRYFIQLFRDDSLRGTPENAVRAGLNLLDSLVLQRKYQQFWRYHNSVKQAIFDLKKENFHYFYHYLIMEAVVTAKMLPSEVQFSRVAYALERAIFLYPYGLKDSLQKYLEIIDVPWVTEHVAPYAKMDLNAVKLKPVPDSLLDQLCKH